MNSRFSANIIQRSEALIKSRGKEALAIAIKDYHPLEVIEYLVEVKEVPWNDWLGRSVTTVAIHAGRLDVLQWFVTVKRKSLAISQSTNSSAILEAVVTSKKIDCFLWIMNLNPFAFSWEKLVDFLLATPNRHYMYAPFFCEHSSYILAAKNADQFLAMMNKFILCEEAFEDDFRMYNIRPTEAVLLKVRESSANNLKIVHLLDKYCGSLFDKSARDPATYVSEAANRAYSLKSMYGQGNAVKFAILKDDSLQVIQYLVEMLQCCLSARDAQNTKVYAWHIMHLAATHGRVDVLTWLVDKKGFGLSFNAENRVDLLKRALTNTMSPALDVVIWLMKKYPDDCDNNKVNQVLDEKEVLSPKLIFDIRVKLYLEQGLFGEIEKLCLSKVAEKGPCLDVARLGLAKLLFESRLHFVGQNNPLAVEGMEASEMLRAIQGHFFLKDSTVKEAVALKEKFSLILSEGRAGGVEAWTQEAAQFYARFALYMHRPDHAGINDLISWSIPDRVGLFQGAKRRRLEQGEVVELLLPGVMLPKA